jgi:hypothetical protein
MKIACALVTNLALSYDGEPVNMLPEIAICTEPPRSRDRSPSWGRSSGRDPGGDDTCLTKWDLQLSRKRSFLRHECDHSFGSQFPKVIWLETHLKNYVLLLAPRSEFPDDKNLNIGYASLSPEG